MQLETVVMLSHVNMLVDFSFCLFCCKKAGFPSSKQPFNFKMELNDWLALKSKYSVKLAIAENQRVSKGVCRIPENRIRSSVSLYVIIASMLPDRMLPLSLVHNLSGQTNKQDPEKVAAKLEHFNNNVTQTYCQLSFVTEMES